MSDARAAEGGRLVIRRPDDWHVHLRDGDMLAAVLPFTVRQFARAIVMPNLAPPVTTTEAALAYRRRILDLLPGESDFEPLMTFYLVDDFAPAEIVRGREAQAVTACKLYPANATTNSAHGVTRLRSLWPALETMERLGMPLLVHGEVTDPDVDIFDREAVFIERVLAPLVGDFPGLKVVLEHITTAEAVAFVEASGPNVAATITPQHLAISRNALFEGGLRPHHYCLPVLKRERHRREVVRAATSASRKFFLGTDSAPHLVGRKESDCGCAGIFNAPFALETYAELFEAEGALDRLEAFASENGPLFYGLPLNEGRVVLERSGSDVPPDVPAAGSRLVPFRAGERLAWRFVGAER